MATKTLNKICIYGCRRPLPHCLPILTGSWGLAGPHNLFWPAPPYDGDGIGAADAGEMRTSPRNHALMCPVLCIVHTCCSCPPPDSPISTYPGSWTSGPMVPVIPQGGAGPAEGHRITLALDPHLSKLAPLWVTLKVVKVAFSKRVPST